jgi:hypothetical protein
MKKMHKQYNKRRRTMGKDKPKTIREIIEDVYGDIESLAVGYHLWRFTDNEYLVEKKKYIKEFTKTILELMEGCAENCTRYNMQVNVRGLRENKEGKLIYLDEFLQNLSELGK